MTRWQWFVGAMALVVAAAGTGYRSEVRAAGRVDGDATPALVARDDAGEGRARSSTEDPANLKGEQVRAVDQEPLEEDRGAKGLEQMLRKLGTRASLMMIVAHPDDEDGGMLAYESRGQGARVGMLTLTRGEGGQNVVTGDFNEALGLVRTRELLAADRYMGVDQMFGTEVDFGFSKTKEEAFAQWTHERVLYDAVRAVRLYRPLVITAVFVGGPTDGHGQHQVSGEMAQEVFTAAADPKVFPEMGLPVWAPLKVYARVPFAQVNAQGMFDYATGKYVPARFYNYVSKAWSTEEPKATVTVPEGEPSALLGKSYVQFARQGLALQRTQIGGGARLAPAGRFDVGYTRYGAARGLPVKDKEAGFFDGVDVSLPGIAELAPGMRGAEREQLSGGLRRLHEMVKRAVAEFDRAAPAKSAPVLRDGLKELDALLAATEGANGMDERERYDVLHELRVKRVQLNDALVLALGLSLDAGLRGGSAGATGGMLVAGSPYEIRASLRNGSGVPVEVDGCTIEEHPGAVERRVELAVDFCAGYRAAGGVAAQFEKTASGRIPDDVRGVRVPYTKKNPDQPFYDVSDPRMRDAALPLPALTAWITMKYGGVPLRVGRVVGAEEHGAYQPVTVVPAVSVGVIPEAGVTPLKSESFVVTAHVRGNVAGTKGTVRLALPGGWKAKPESAAWSSEEGGSDTAVPFVVTPERLSENPYTMTAVAESGGKEYREGFQVVGYPGVVRDRLYSPATYRTRGVDVRVPAGLRVAYLPGTGDAVEASMNDLGIHATRVSVPDIAAGRLAGYDALVLGVRTYAAQKDLPSVTQQLTAFASAGGVVVVQYQTPEYEASDAPYPLSLGGSAEKVVEEDSRVQLSTPGAQVLSWPNRISEKDFSGWVEERGHGFMREWDPRYEAVTEVHDVGQDPQKGGLLVARVGKGAYVYCAYALYRQLPEGVPGAFRLLANMVSLGKRP